MSTCSTQSGSRKGTIFAGPCRELSDWRSRTRNGPLMQCEQDSTHPGEHPMSKQWTTFILAGLLLTAGCSKDATGIDPAWFGTYHLLSVDGKTPPQVVSEAGANVTTSVTSMSLTF